MHIYILYYFQVQFKKNKQIKEIKHELPHIIKFTSKFVFNGKILISFFICEGYLSNVWVIDKKDSKISLHI